MSLFTNANIKMRWVQVTIGLTLKSNTFFKPLDLSRSNGQKNIIINANILIKISLIVPHLLYFISISNPQKKSCIWPSLSLSPRFSLYLFLLHRLLNDKGCVNVNSFSRFWVQINGFHMQPRDWKLIWKRLKLEIQPKQGKLSYLT